MVLVEYLSEFQTVLVCLSMSEFQMVLVDYFPMVIVSACHCQMVDATDLLIADEEAIEGESEVYCATQSRQKTWVGHFGQLPAGYKQQMLESLCLSVYIGHPCIESLAMSGKNRVLQNPFINCIFAF